MNNKTIQNRREFLQNLAVGSGGIIVLGGLGFIFPARTSSRTIKAIVVDFDKCTGCRTCESVCSAYNHKVEVQGELLDGLGNPELSNIKVWHYNPDVDVPVTCFLCEDNPCIEACPTTPDLITGRKALYRDDDLHIIKNNIDRCLGCEQCAKACKAMRGGVIFPNKDTGMPERMCRMCDGDPQCVKYCTYDALSFLEITPDLPLRERSPHAIASLLAEKYYETKLN
jgi:Fe-S-cluster-containing hydrogenase component 2